MGEEAVGFFWCLKPGMWEEECEGFAGLFRLEDLAATYSPASWDAVPLALRDFTAEFGMGSGVGPLAVTTRSSRRKSEVSDQKPDSC
jgi:hypothetical protein